MIGKAIDSIIGIISPRWAVQRTLWRARSSSIRAAASEHKSMQKMLGTGRGGYEAGKVNRLTEHNFGSAHENDLDRNQITNMRNRSWNLYRNNPQARKIIRTLNAKVIGRGMNPQPQTVLPDGKPFVAFRKKARSIWKEASKELDFRGKPGRGGQHLVQLHKRALTHAILSGGCLMRFHHLKKREQNSKRLLLPLQIRLMHIDRLDETKHNEGDRIFYGVQLNADNIPESYWLKSGGVKSDDNESSAIPAKELIHFYPEDDIDQILGSPQFCAALLTADDRRHYEESELTAAEMGSKFVAGYRRSSGQTGLGLPNTDEDWDLTDSSGNKIEYLQSGMFVDLGKEGSFDMINMNRPNSGAEAFLNHLIRGEAVGMPGVKASTLTGDYRNSSFSSERSADNDAWPELEDLQDWISCSFSQPIYEEVIKAAVLAGLFDDVDGFTTAAFSADQRNYLNANWQGPVARSINPKDDVKAAMDRVKSGTSSVQKEASKIAADWRENLEDAAEFMAYCEELGLPEDFCRQALGMMPEVPDPAGSDDSEQTQDAATATRNRMAAIVGFQSRNHAKETIE